MPARGSALRREKDFDVGHCASRLNKQRRVTPITALQNVDKFQTQVWMTMFK
jgi:hypothetical protein